jgi:hypothetical protein
LTLASLYFSSPAKKTDNILTSEARGRNTLLLNMCRIRTKPIPLNAHLHHVQNRKAQNAESSGWKSSKLPSYFPQDAPISYFGRNTAQKQSNPQQHETFADINPYKEL